MSPGGGQWQGCLSAKRCSWPLDQLLIFLLLIFLLSHSQKLSFPSSFASSFLLSSGLNPSSYNPHGPEEDGLPSSAKWFVPSLMMPFLRDRLHNLENVSSLNMHTTVHKMVLTLSMQLCTRGILCSDCNFTSRPSLEQIRIILKATTNRMIEHPIVVPTSSCCHQFINSCLAKNIPGPLKQLATRLLLLPFKWKKLHSNVSELLSIPKMTRYKKKCAQVFIQLTSCPGLVLPCPFDLINSPWLLAICSLAWLRSWGDGCSAFILINRQIIHQHQLLILTCLSNLCNTESLSTAIFYLIWLFRCNKYILLGVHARSYALVIINFSLYLQLCG